MDEYISREEVIKKIKSCISAADDAWESGYNTAMTEIMEYFKHIPAADVEPVKHGKWEQDICTNCGKSLEELFEGEFYYDREELHFCPNCGARMEGDSE